MKKIFAVMMAAATIAMVGCKKDDKGSSPEIKSTVPEVAATEGAFTIVWNAVDYSECNDLVFAGNQAAYYKENGDVAWSTALDDLVAFEPIEGYKNWYKAVVYDNSEMGITQTDGLQGKPCALAADGTFPTGWDHQWIGSEEHPCEVVKGDASFEVEYKTETKMIIPEAGAVVWVRSYGFKVDPCVEIEKYDITFNLEVGEAISEENVINIVGGFPGKSWTNDGELYEMTRVDEKHFTITIQDCPLGVEYKYIANGSWDNEMYPVAPEEGDECIAKQKGNNTTSDVAVNDFVAGFFGVTTTLPQCEEEPEEPVVGEGWFIKHPWGTGADEDWSYQQMSEENGVFVYTGLWGGVGANINQAASDAGADWFPAADIEGAEGLELGQEVTFVYDPEAETLAIRGAANEDEEEGEE